MSGGQETHIHGSAQYLENTADDVRDDEELQVPLEHRVRERRDEPARRVVDINRGAVARASLAPLSNCAASAPPAVWRKRRAGAGCSYR
jgi:hypothetical protein